MKIVGRKATDLFATSKAASAARAVVKARRDKRVGDVKKRIADCKTVVTALDNGEQTQRRATSAFRFRFQNPSVIADCPACSSKVLLRGTLFQISEPKLVNGDFESEARFVTDKVACPACKLRLRGATEVSVVGLPLRFHVMMAYDLHESPDEEEEYDNM